MMWRVGLFVLLFNISLTVVQAGELRAVVSDDTGAMQNAVIFATPLNESPLPPPRHVTIDQIDKLFVPFVTAVPVGTTVSFPNNDNIKHHVYSVSPAKPFERPLYQGQSAAPVQFDKPGIVILGCNIHDWMIAHILVLETPYSAVTDTTGRAAISGLPNGDYEVQAWHPGIKNKNRAATKPIRVTLAGDPVEITFKINLLPKKMWWLEKPKDADARYKPSNSVEGGN